MKQVCVIGDYGKTSTRNAKVIGHIKMADPDLEVIEGNHYIPSGSYNIGASMLYMIIPFFPKETIVFTSMDEQCDTYVAAVMEDGQIAVCSDNGVMTVISKVLKIKDYYVLNSHSELETADLIGKMACGTAVGECGHKVDVSELTMLPWPEPIIEKGYVEGCIFMVKMFGNCTINVSYGQFEDAGFEPGDLVHMEVIREGETLFDGIVPVCQSFGFVGEGEPLIFNGSSGFMDFGLNRDNFVLKHFPGLVNELDHCDIYKVRLTMSEKGGHGR